MNPSNILSKLKQRIQNNLQFLDRLFLLNSCAWTGMYFGYAVGKNVDVFYFLPILIIWLVYYTFFIIFIRGKSYC